jgi:hypothetical protein
VQYHSLFLSADGRLWACGDGSRGRLGVGAHDDCFLPTAVRHFFVEGRKARRPRRIGDNGLPLCLGFGQVDPVLTRTPYWPGRRGRLQVPAARLPADMERELGMLDDADAAGPPCRLWQGAPRKRPRGRQAQQGGSGWRGDKAAAEGGEGAVTGGEGDGDGGGYGPGIGATDVGDGAGDGARPMPMADGAEAEARWGKDGAELVGCLDQLIAEKRVQDEEEEAMLVQVQCRAQEKMMMVRR